MQISILLEVYSLKKAVPLCQRSFNLKKIFGYQFPSVMLLVITMTTFIKNWELSFDEGLIVGLIILIIQKSTVYFIAKIKGSTE
ncbi:hypothetical protein WG906_11150 [Pedobacter sp. P351]|uniref:hypothetical protein n=1 Tax=Pedobacter superstes TaxID=3133441 RepID=UPI0030AEEFFA